mmetsp:Transcript_9228/g.13027  ORF Transcript_9228/g.13027 Transcript_9228/m.13027 type:complete len:118 (-) Transcript_9228:44-397(-)
MVRILVKERGPLRRDVILCGALGQVAPWHLLLEVLIEPMMLGQDLLNGGYTMATQKILSLMRTRILRHKGLLLRTQGHSKSKVVDTPNIKASAKDYMEQPHRQYKVECKFSSSTTAT